MSNVTRLPSFGWGIGIFFLCTALVLTVGTALQALSMTAGFAVTELFLILLPVILIVRWKKFDGRETLSLHAPRSRDALLAIVAGAGGWVLAAKGTLWMLDGFGIDERTLSLLRPPNVPLAVLLAVLAGPCEEILFRGFILTGLRARYRPVHAMVLTALLFSVFHQNMISIPGAFFLGLIYGIILLRTGSIHCAIAAHLVNNTCSVTLTRTQWGIAAAPAWQITAAAAVLVASLCLIGRGRRAEARPLPAKPKRPYLVYGMAILLILSVPFALPLQYAAMEFMNTLRYGGTVQFDRYRMRDDLSYRKESTIILQGKGVGEWMKEECTIRIYPGDNLVSVRSGGGDVPFTVNEDGTATVTFAEAPKTGSLFEVVCEGKFDPEGPFHFPAYRFARALGIKTTIDLRGAAGLRFHDTSFRVKTPMYITWPDENDWTAESGYCVVPLIRR